MNHMSQLSDTSPIGLVDGQYFDTMESSINMNFYQTPAHFARHPDLEKVQSTFNFETDVLNDNPNIVYNDQKLFVKMNSTLTINASYTPPMSQEHPQMYLRGMVLFSSIAEMHLPVKRCKNHRVVTPTMDATEYAKASNIMKVTHPRVVYMGDDEATTYGQRLSIYVPLDKSLFDPETNRVTESIRLEFGCQNSCSSGINRKNTSMVFTLEDGAGNLAGKAAIQFKVCSCPKRDAERDNRDNKRKHDSTDAFPKGKRPMFNTPSELRTNLGPTIKTEPSSDGEAADANGGGSTNSMTTEVKLNIPTYLVPKLLEQANQIIAGAIIATNEQSSRDSLFASFKGIEKLQKEFKRN